MKEKYYIMSGARTAVGKYLGSLKTVPPEILASVVIRETLQRGGFEASEMDAVILGQVMIDAEARKVARVSALLAGVPEEIPAYTIDLQCGSSMQAVRCAIGEISSGSADMVLAGGVKNMSRGIYYLPPSVRYEGFRLGDKTVYDSFSRGSERVQPPALYPGLNMGLTAENVAARYGITRQQQDAFAFDSQRKACRAIETGRFEEEIVPVHVETRKEAFDFCVDEFPKPDITMEKLASMKPAFKKDGTGTVTSGNASGMNDGASAVILLSENAVKKTGRKPMAAILDHVVVGTDPAYMGLGPVSAVRTLLERNQLTMDDIDLIELNEAFAAQSLGVLTELDLLPGTKGYEKVNVNGGAIALGHALGNSGTRILITLMYELKKRKGHLGIATLCIGGGQGIAMLIENME